MVVAPDSAGTANNAGTHADVALCAAAHSPRLAFTIINLRWLVVSKNRRSIDSLVLLPEPLEPGGQGIHRP